MAPRGDGLCSASRICIAVLRLMQARSDDLGSGGPVAGCVLVHPLAIARSHKKGAPMEPLFVEAQRVAIYAYQTSDLCLSD